MNRFLIAIVFVSLAVPARGLDLNDVQCRGQWVQVPNGIMCQESSQTYVQPRYAPIELNAEPEHAQESAMSRAYQKLDAMIEKWKDPSARQPVDDNGRSNRKYAPIDLGQDSVISPSEAAKNDFARRNRSNPNYDGFYVTVREPTIQPPKGYTDPYENKPLPKPGQLERYTNCTFNSPSCR